MFTENIKKAVIRRFINNSNHYKKNFRLKETLMTVEFVRGDLLNPMKEDAIAHGCNCLGRMGAGIAKEIKRIWPEEMMEEYEKLCSSSIQPGEVQYLSYSGFPLLINMFTQKSIWRDKAGLSPAKLEWIKECLEDIIQKLSNSNSQIKTVGMPRIGAGLGGLEWKDVKALITKVCGPVSDLHFVVYEHFIPSGRL